MLKKIRVLAIGLVGMALSSVAIAQSSTTNKLFFGGGLSSNEVSDSDSATGWQVFGGYVFGEVAPKLFIDGEVGYMDTGTMKRNGADFKANGLWTTGVARYMVAPNVELLGRLGIDFGDDDGLMAGIGVGFLLNKNMKLRLEYVQRDRVDSVQFNFVFTP